MQKPRFPYWRRCAHKIPEHALAIAVEDVTVRYPGLKNNILENISFELESGKIAALTGPNGAGKSTLLKALVGLLPITSGRITLLGHPISACQHYVTYLPQRSDIDWSFPISVFKLVLTGSYLRLGWLHRPGPDEHRLAHEALQLLGLEEFRDRQIGQLSVGQQQRALLARCLVHNAELFLLDEPLNAVDEETRSIMKSTFDKLKAEGKTLLIATHDRERIARDFDVRLRIENRSIKKG